MDLRRRENHITNYLKNWIFVIDQFFHFILFYFILLFYYFILFYFIISIKQKKAGRGFLGIGLVLGTLWAGYTSLVNVDS